MSEILTETIHNAYMIRNDGKEFRILQHIYGNADCVEETLAAAEWLYSATANDSTRKLILDFIASWATELNATDDLMTVIHQEIDSRPYKFLTHEFINSVELPLTTEAKRYEVVQDLNELVVHELNQEFLRARYGGMYNSVRGNRDMIFRVSSAYFNWFNIIFNFVYDRKAVIDTVTVVKDEESTGFDTPYSHHGVELYALPIDEFIMLPGNPIIEELEDTSVEEEIAHGSSILDATEYHMNYGRLNNRWAAKAHKYHLEHEDM